jgi:two-component system nitrate/nitrite sensor histidine kinase NarX
MASARHRGNWFKRSLLLRLGIAMTAIFLLAVIGMLSSVFIAETIRGYAAAINQAGTLRMQSYRIASSLVHGASLPSRAALGNTRRLVEEFRQRLFSQRIHAVLARRPSTQVLVSYGRVETQWQDRMQPLLDAYLARIDGTSGSGQGQAEVTELKLGYLDQVDRFVEEIHRFVAALELDAENKNRQLRLIQLICLMLVFGVASLSLYLVKTNVLRPLKDLLVCANTARQGDFSTRSHYLGEDELGQLGHAFNVMAEDLSKLYADLEARVQAKTADLERSNRSLELLYTTSRRLNDASALDQSVLEAIIHDIERLLGARAGTIRLAQPGDDPGPRFVSTRTAQTDGFEGLCEDCRDGDRPQQLAIWREPAGAYQLATTPIRDKSRRYGLLLVEFPADMTLEAWQQRLLQTVAQHIAMAINAAQQVAQHRMLALLEERSVIARELHDSLAQSLSYLKIQVSRLEKRIKDQAPMHDVLTVSQGLRSGLNGAYRQLRELLTTFRLRIQEADLGAAVAATVAEYSQRGDLPIECENRLVNCRPGPNAEIHVIQIVREALSNVIRHANASRARVSLDCDEAGEVRVVIEDNGTGVQEQIDMLHHYGMPIMRERAAWLGGGLQVTETPGGGTRVELTFSLRDSDHRPTVPRRVAESNDG